MNDQEKIKAAISMLSKLQRMVGFFMKKEIAELIGQLEECEFKQPIKKPMENDFL